MNLRRTSKKQAKIKLALQGCAGSGKTYSALLLAYGLCGEWSKIAVIDSENGSADLYAHLGNYNVLPLQDSFTPETYMEAIGICENAGMEVIIIDSISQCWDNLLEYHANLQGNSFTNWQKVTPRINAFMHKILQSDKHIICTMRCKQDYVLNEKNGKMVPDARRAFAGFVMPKLNMTAGLSELYQYPPVQYAGVTTQQKLIIAENTL